MPLRITDAIDMHCHFGPDTIGGLEGGGGHSFFTGVDAAREAKESGHAAIVLKSHSFASPALAENLEALVPGMRVFGGICTDYPSGGLNVDAIESALGLGAKIVWLPTVHSHEDYPRRSSGRMAALHDEGIRVTDDDGGVLPVVHEIFDLVNQMGAILATGHISAAEHYAIVRELAPRGKVLVTHAGEELAGPKLTAAQCRELADLGATIELTALSCQDVMGITGKSPSEMASFIGEVGYERCTLSSDYGWAPIVPRPAAGLTEFLESLWDVGLPEAALETMVRTNPARLLDLELA
jgi:hypothetical protein